MDETTKNYRRQNTLWNIFNRCRHFTRNFKRAYAKCVMLIKALFFFVVFSIYEIKNNGFHWKKQLISETDFCTLDGMKTTVENENIDNFRRT